MTADWTTPDEPDRLISILYAGPTEATAADRIAIALNAGNDPVAVDWPDARTGFIRRRSIDTSLTAGAPGPGDLIASDSALVAARSIVVLVEGKGCHARAQRGGIEPEFSTASQRPPGLQASGGTWPASTTASAPTPSAHCSLQWAGPRTPPATHARIFSHAPTGGKHASCQRSSSAAKICRQRLPRAIGHSPRQSTALRLRSKDGIQRMLPFHHRCTSRDHGDGPRMGVSSTGASSRCRRCRSAITLGFDDDSTAGALCQAVTPDRCFLPPAELRGGGRWNTGLAAHLYGAAAARRLGIGDFTTLSAIAKATARAGGSIVGINPLHMLFAEDRERASPYHPSDRRFLDPIYIDVESVPDFAASNGARAQFAKRRSADRGPRGAQRRRLRDRLGGEAGSAGSVFRPLRRA